MRGVAAFHGRDLRALSKRRAGGRKLRWKAFRCPEFATDHQVDASRWTSPLDFYDALLPALGAPDWHGDSVNALVESMVWGEINSLESPFRVEVDSAANLPPEVAEEVRWTAEGVVRPKIAFAKMHERTIEVDFKIVG